MDESEREKLNNSDIAGSAAISYVFLTRSPLYANDDELAHRFFYTVLPTDQRKPLIHTGIHIHRDEHTCLLEFLILTPSRKGSCTCA